MLKPPEASVSTVRSAPVPTFFAETDAFGTTAPCGSRTVPRIVPVMFWAAGFRTFASKHTMHKRKQVRILGLFLAMHPSFGPGFALVLNCRLCCVTCRSREIKWYRSKPRKLAQHI